MIIIFRDWLTGAFFVRGQLTFEITFQRGALFPFFFGVLHFSSLDWVWVMASLVFDKFGRAFLDKRRKKLVSLIS